MRKCVVEELEIDGKNRTSLMTECRNDDSLYSEIISMQTSHPVYPIELTNMIDREMKILIDLRYIAAEYSVVYSERFLSN